MNDLEAGIKIRKHLLRRIREIWGERRADVYRRTIDDDGATGYRPADDTLEPSVLDHARLLAADDVIDPTGKVSALVAIRPTPATTDDHGRIVLLIAGMTVIGLCERLTGLGHVDDADGRKEGR